MSASSDTQSFRNMVSETMSFHTAAQSSINDKVVDQIISKVGPKPSFYVANEYCDVFQNSLTISLTKEQLIEKINEFTKDQKDGREAILANTKRGIDRYVMEMLFLSETDGNIRRVLKLVNQFRTNEQFLQSLGRAVGAVNATLSEDKKIPGTEGSLAGFELLHSNELVRNALREEYEMSILKTSKVPDEVREMENWVNSINQTLREGRRVYEEKKERLRIAQQKLAEEEDEFGRSAAPLISFARKWGEIKRADIDLPMKNVLRVRYDSDDNLKSTLTFEQFLESYRLHNFRSSQSSMAQELSKLAAFTNGYSVLDRISTVFSGHRSTGIFGAVDNRDRMAVGPKFSPVAPIRVKDVEPRSAEAKLVVDEEFIRSLSSRAANTQDEGAEAKNP
ncbi:hypothetical protein [Exobasidium gracile zybavirus 2-3]|nr:hypothetical protein [Exobasidium gracile zybavirus 2-3]